MENKELKIKDAIAPEAHQLLAEKLSEELLRRRIF